MKKTIMIMIDGFGIPEKGWFDSVYSEYCRSEFIELMAEFAIPVDASMGVAGIPQSATGQSALFSGRNTAEVMHGHIQGFPGPTLRKLISEQNLFASLIKRGLKVVFANAYVQYTLNQLAEMRYRSVTTVMTASAIGQVKNIDDLIAGDAVYHDITRKSISDKFNVQEIVPQQAAKDLANIAGKHDFTLFEYFMTDRAGHKMDSNMLATVLSDFSEFFCSLIGYAKDEFVVILTSDHGNCEDINQKQHTTNPVPFFLYGLPLSPPGEVRSIEDIYKFVVNL